MSDVVFKIYKVTGQCGRAYVGITRMTVKARWETHLRCKQGGIFYDLIREKGRDWFTVETLCEAYSIREAIACERAMIAVHNTYYKQGGLNRNIGGGGNVKDTASEQERRLKSEAAKRMYEKNPDLRFAGTRAYNAMGRPVSPDGHARKLEGLKSAHTKEVRARASATRLRNIQENPEIENTRKRDEQRLINYEKALAYRVGRIRPHRFHPSYADQTWHLKCGPKKMEAA